MGYQPLPPRKNKNKAQPKEEHPSGFEASQGPHATLPVSPYTGDPYDPAWGYRRMSAPRVRFDPKLIGKEYR